MSTCALVKEIVAERPKRTFRECIFCGYPATGRACTAHKDLLQKDPYTVARGGAAA